jgi:NAD(P)H-hydrate epimerase
VLIVGGSLGMSGAPAIAGRAALRSGAGLVRVAVPQSILGIVAAIEPCYTTIPLADDDAGRISNRAVAAVLEGAAQNDVVAFGPGLGIARGVKDVLAALLAVENLRLVIDADGLNCLAKIGNWPRLTKASVIVTPHPGEMKRLCQGLLREPLPDDRTVQATTLAQGTGCVVVLKGAGTVVTDGAKVYINQSGNPGMATAGAGDVLTGIIAALVGQKMSNFDAAVLGVYIHGLSGDIAAEKTGQISLIATDIIESLGPAFSKS